MKKYYGLIAMTLCIVSFFIFFKIYLETKMFINISCSHAELVELHAFTHAMNGHNTENGHDFSCFAYFIGEDGRKHVSTYWEMGDCSDPSPKYRLENSNYCEGIPWLYDVD